MARTVSPTDQIARQHPLDFRATAGGASTVVVMRRVRATAAVALLALVATAGAALASDLPSPHRPQHLSACVVLDAHCLTDVLGDDPTHDEAVALWRQALQLAPQLVGFCHDYFHVAGARAAKAGRPLLMDPVCVDAYTHGQLEVRLADVPTGRLLGRASALCSAAPDRSLRNGCLHGAGHVFYSRLGADRARDLCAELDADASIDCARGVHMELNHEVEGTTGADSRLLALCRTARAEHRASCYLYAPSIWSAVLGRTPPRLLRRCGREPEPATCAQGMGQVFFRWNDGDYRRTLADCRHGAIAAALARPCTRATAFMEDMGRVAARRATADICDPVTPAYRDACRDGVADGEAARRGLGAAGLVDAGHDAHTVPGDERTT